MTEPPEIEPAELDLVVLAQLTGTALSRETIRRLAARGHPGARDRHGYLLQHVVAGPAAIGRIAEGMGVTQQAVSKSASELEELGYVERTVDPADARVRMLALTERGRDLIETARAIRAELEEEIRAERSRDLLAARRVLLAALEVSGGLEAVRARRVPPPS